MQAVREDVTEAEFEVHLKQHGVMFCDGEKRIECLCGEKISYELAYELGFESVERMARKKKGVFDVLANL